MSEFLKQYHLYDDLSRLNHDQYYQPCFDTPDILQFFTSLTTPQQIHYNTRTIKIYFFNLKHTIDKNIYLVLKWLIVSHRLIHSIKHARLIQEMYETLSKMGKPMMSQKIDQYIYGLLIKPYVHYLQKLCLLEIRNKEGSFSNNNKENMRESPQEIWYIKYNLLKFASKQFTSPMTEFSGYFKEYYPFLLNYGKQIQNDLKNILKELKKDHVKSSKSMISLQELTNLESAITSMTDSNIDEVNEEIFLTDMDLCSSQLHYFLQSGCKQQIDRTSHSLDSN